jgi:hypothetical protein
MAKKKKDDFIPVGEPLPVNKKPVITQDPRYLQKCKEELAEFGRKRILTTTIKILETIEETYGDQWNHFSKEKKTKEQERQYHRWKNARKFILSFAHDQIALLEEELEFYDISKKWFNIHITMKEEDE